MYQYKQQMPEQGLPSSEFGCNSVTTISYNVHSAMSEPRLEAVLEDLTGLQWDIVILVETWREARTERVCLEAGHCWYGSGGCKGRCGVGSLVHKRHV